MSNDRLTRQELTWLLAQEARGAAKSLREGVTRLSKPPPAPVIQEAPAPPADVTTNVSNSLDALDEAIGMLSALQSSSKPKGTRKGRIDLAALLMELAPTARIAMEPGAGTEVLGDEVEMRRMLQVLLSQSQPGGATADVHIFRQDEWVKVSVELGPDMGAVDQTEYRWLSRMAMRHGGKVELEAGTHTLTLPADGAADQREVEELRRELEQAQQLGEVYARELAAAFAATPEEAPATAAAPTFAGNQLQLLSVFANVLARPLRDVFQGLRNDVGHVAETAGDGEVLRRLNGRVSQGYELVGELARLAECSTDEAAEAKDPAQIVARVIEEAEGRASRHSVKLKADLNADRCKLRPASFAFLVRSLLDHAIAATPQGDRVQVTLTQGKSLELLVDDGGPVVPANSRGDVVHGRVDATSLGRPAGLSLMLASIAAAAQGASIELGESGDSRALTKAVFPL